MTVPVHYPHHPKHELARLLIEMENRCTKAERIVIKLIPLQILDGVLVYGKGAALGLEVT